MLVIGLETSGLVGGIALLRDDVVLEARTLGQSGRRHAQSLVLELGDVLKSHGVTSDAVDVIAVGRGPGSFTGLRVGLVCAKTFAYSTGCHFCAVDTFEAIADNCPDDVANVWVVENAQRGDLFAGQYVRDVLGRWIQRGEVAIVAGNEWLSQRESVEVVTGPGLAHCDLSQVSARLLTDETIAVPSAIAVARLGRQKVLFQLQEKNDLEHDSIEGDSKTELDSKPEMNFWKAVPFYIRPSAAEETRMKRDGIPKP